MWIFFFLFVLIILLFFWNSVTPPKLWRSPSKKHLNNIIDNALFFRSFTNLDLKARSAISIEQYIKDYKTNLKTFTPKESLHLDRLISSIDDETGLPWIMVKFEKNENNYPHTLGDIIFLPQNFFDKNMKSQAETLYHEKIHVYQRAYPIETAKFIANLGFEIVASKTQIQNIRANPDLNSFVYKNKDTIQYQAYTSDDPKNLSDSALVIAGPHPWDFSVSQQEHPYEIMACLIAQKRAFLSA